MSTPVTLGATTTADDVLAGRDLRGTRVLVTGASGGIGLETARALAAHGAAVTLAARDAAKLESAARGIAGRSGNADVDWLQVDLASLASVREAVRSYAGRHDRLNVLVNNAGVMASPLMYSADGHEMQFAVCHLGHFLLTCLLVPLLERGAPARVVNLSSGGHKLGGVDFEDPDFRARPYDKWVSYGQAKTANILFSVELTRRLAGCGITANAVHPGAIATTDLARHLGPSDFGEMMRRTKFSDRVPFKSMEAGAATSVWAAVAPELEGCGGLYLEDCHVAEVSDDPDNGQSGCRSYATDPLAARRLWSLSEQLAGERFAWGDDD
ncbi:MAG: SDR family NAD(P)-dependent oxidoreductase [Pseudomonadales bacterium]|nr:SDR family NAD(P)-dependent oxidoreductase [Pseudomonadales bacterium]MBP9033304.1 SDR family NAD(P)-dependent oxidoreductase [Pseudomonadales bacterium]